MTVSCVAVNWGCSATPGEMWRTSPTCFKPSEYTTVIVRITKSLLFVPTCVFVVFVVSVLLQAQQNKQRWEHLFDTSRSFFRNRMHHFPHYWIIHLRAAFVCILCSEEDVSWAAANCLLERKCIPSLWWALNESLSLPLSPQILCLFLIFISRRFAKLAIAGFQYYPQALGTVLLCTPKSTL